MTDHDHVLIDDGDVCQICGEIICVDCGRVLVVVEGVGYGHVDGSECFLHGPASGRVQS